MDKKLLIFDLDGTLADTQAIIDKILHGAMLEYGIDLGSLDDVRALLEESGGIMIDERTLAPKKYADELDHARYAQLYAEKYAIYSIASADRIYDGIPQALKALSAMGHVLAVLTNKPQEHAVPIIHKAFGEELFATVLGGLDGMPRKPAPDGIFRICDQLGFAPEDAYVIGDLPTDVLAAKAANAGYIVAGWGYGSGQELESLSAERIARTPLDLVDIIKAETDAL